MLKTVSVRAGLCTLVMLPSLLAAAPSERDIDRAVERAMDTFDVPGMTVAVVQDGEIAYAKGHGIAEMDRPGAVDEHTLYRIGSVSKAFTAAALAVLADDGKLSFDDRVIDHIPEFQMYDAWVTREFTIRDLLTHRSGLPLGAGDLLIFPDGDSTAADIIRAFRYLQPTSSFRSKYDYDNLMYIAAGEVIARASGMTFEAFVEQRLLQPLGMEGCVASPERSSADWVVATPHLFVEDELQVTGSGLTPVSAPAGGITCSATGMTRWMNMMLNQGVMADGEPLLSPSQYAQLIQPVTLVPTPGYMEDHAGAHLSAYALGWNVTSFYGEPLLAHAGGVWGMTTYLMLFPDQNLGVFASVNLMSPASRAVVMEIADEFLAEESGSENKDWIGLMDGLYKAGLARAEEAVAAANESRAAESKPSLPLEAYVGTFQDPWYGTIHISLEDGALWFRSDRNQPLQGRLEHFQYDTFIARWNDRRLKADAYVSFTLTPEGEADRIKMKAVSPATDFSFDFHDLDLVRVPAAN